MSEHARLSINGGIPAEIAHVYEPESGDCILSTGAAFTVRVGGEDHVFTIPGQLVENAAGRFRLARRENVVALAWFEKLRRFASLYGRRLRSEARARFGADAGEHLAWAAERPPHAAGPARSGPALLFRASPPDARAGQSDGSRGRQAASRA